MPLSDPVPTEDLLDLYDNAPCGYLSLSPGGRIVKTNRTLAEWIGRASDELLDRPLFELLSFGGRIAYETHIAPMLRLQGYVGELALDMLHADGTKIPVIANAAEKRNADGVHLFTRLTVFKAVERRRYERTLLEARTAAEHAFRDEREMAVLREQFIAVLGHDIRNPLAALAAGVRMLNNREPLSERGRQITVEMAASVARAKALVDDVLDLARGRLGGGIPIECNSDEPLTPVLEHVVSELRAIAPDRLIITDFAVDKPISCDRPRIGQLAANLVSNALTHGAPDLPINVSAATTDGWFRLSVANGGSPIAPAAMEQLFQPFFRGAARPSQQGLGLGLFIASEIAKAHGGTLEVSSSQEQTRFTFAMPRLRNSL